MSSCCCSFSVVFFWFSFAFLLCGTQARRQDLLWAARETLRPWHGDDVYSVSEASSASRRHIIDELADEADSPAHREKYNLVFLLLEHSAFGVSQTCEVFAPILW